MKRLLAYVLLILVFAHLTLAYSPFGSSERADKYVQDLLNTYAGGWIYGAPQENITVLLLNDEALARHQRGHWPASYDFHGRVLNTLLNERPGAVFIDFLWLSRRPDASADAPRDGDYLIKVLQRYRRAGIPVYLASTPAVRQNWPELSGLVTHVAADLDIDYVDFVSRTYPPARHNMPTPAFQMARDNRPGLFPQSPAAPMDIFWGTLPNRKNMSWMVADTREMGVVDVLTTGYSGARTSIPFNTTLYVRDLLHQVAATPEQARRDAAAFIKDKFVLYGANLTGVNDLIFTPTRDILPGVYLHAMALDNLLHWGSGYKSAQGNGLLAQQGWHAAWSLLIVLPVALLLALFHRRPRASAGGSTSPAPQATPLRPGVELPASKLAAWRDQVWRFVDRHPLRGRLFIALALGCWFIGWGAIEFFWLDVSAATFVGYVEFLTLGFFLDKVGLADWLIDDVLVPVRSACTRILRTR